MGEAGSECAGEQPQEQVEEVKKEIIRRTIGLRKMGFF